MLRYRDFVPKQVEAGLFAGGEYESFDEALERANRWIDDAAIQVKNMETVVLPNIWGRWEEGSSDTSLGVGSLSSWNQFIRVWYESQ